MVAMHSHSVIRFRGKQNRSRKIWAHSEWSQVQHSTDWTWLSLVFIMRMSGKLMSQYGDACGNRIVGSQISQWESLQDPEGT